MPPFRYLPLALLLLAPLSARAEWDARSTADAPCGVGEPPIGHLGREMVHTGSETHLSLTVKQAGGRLCYVADGIAEAPVIRVRQGDRLTIDLTDDITDTAAIDAVRPHEPLDKPNLPVARRGPASIP
jgi:hypothetical protein